jgi:ABC-2 type transport system permease protein
MTVTALHPANRRDHTADTDTPWRGSVSPERQVRHPALTRLVTLEIRKTLSTRSGRLLLGTAAVLPAVGISTVLALGQDIPGAREMLAVVGSLVAILTLAVGILSTAGEWTHRTIQTTLLAVPRRGHVAAAKYLAAALTGVAVTALMAASTLTITAIAAGPDFLWTGAVVAVTATIATGAALAAVGAGIGAAITNTAAALTGTFVTLLIAMPLLAAVRPNIAAKIDPLTAMVNIVTDHQVASAVTVLTGWVVVTTTAGAVVTHRKAIA